MYLKENTELMENKEKINLIPRDKGKTLKIIIIIIIRYSDFEK